jgi:23S rRNA pseudouridine2457 synthase
MVVMFHKPFGVLSQFTVEPNSSHRTLADFAFPAGIYPIGRLDADSEGLLFLTDEGDLAHRLTDPRHGHPREYWAQVEGIPREESLRQLAGGVTFQGWRCRPCRAWFLDPPPDLPPRQPPIRYRKNVPDVWIALELTEGRNRQVRRMTAAIGHPTLRLVRVRVGQLMLGNLPPGTWHSLGPNERGLLQKR